MQRSCDCIPSTLQLAAPILTQKSVPFDVLLDISHKITLQWTTVVRCGQCCTDEHTTSTLTQIAARLLTFYEAAFASYSMSCAADPTPQPQSRAPRRTAHSRRSVSPSRASQPSTPTGATTALGSCHCVPSRMTLGERRVEVQQAVGKELLGEDLQWHANSRLAACDALIVQTMNRLAKLVGQLRFDAGPRK